MLVCIVCLSSDHRLIVFIVFIVVVVFIVFIAFMICIVYIVFTVCIVVIVLIVVLFSSFLYSFYGFYDLYRFTGVIVLIAFAFCSLYRCIVLIVSFYRFMCYNKTKHKQTIIRLIIVDRFIVLIVL